MLELPKMYIIIKFIWLLKLTIVLAITDNGKPRVWLERTDIVYDYSEPVRLHTTLCEDIIYILKTRKLFLKNTKIALDQRAFERQYKPSIK